MWIYHLLLGDGLGSERNLENGRGRYRWDEKYAREMRGRIWKAILNPSEAAVSMNGAKSRNGRGCLLYAFNNA